ncbi:MAG: hypothetical protein ACJ8OJ_07575 [Povalibacter sp.]
MKSRVALAISALLFGSLASAANWEFAPVVEGGWRVSDNYRLGPPGTEVEVSGAEVDAAVTMRTVDPRLQIELTPRITTTRFPGDDEQESTDYYFTGVLADHTPVRDMGIRGDFSQEDVVRSELPSPGAGGDLGSPETGDSGRALERSRRDMINLTPYWYYSFSELNRLELSGRYIDANFSHETGDELQDFSQSDISAGWRRHYSERSSFLLRAVASEFYTNFTTDSYGADFQWDHDFSPVSRMYARIGGRNISSDERGEDTSFVAGLGGRWSSQRNQLFLDLTRTVEPISAGTVVERYQLRLRLDHDISPRVALVFGLRGAHDQDVDDASTYPTRKFASGEVGVEWRVQRVLSLTATYNRLWQEYEDEPADRNSNGFLISLVYEPKRTD